MADHQTKHQDHEKQFNPPGVEKPYNYDTDLMHEVKDALLKGTESAGIDVHVSAEDGTVRLSGVVDVLSHKRTAEEIARRVMGVKRIVNDITVADEEHQSDKHVMEMVTDRLSGHPEYRDIGCRVHKGVVVLVGHAGSDADVQDAVRLVEGMPGIREVRLERVKVGEGRDDDDADVSRKAEHLLDTMGFDHRLFQVYCDAGTLHVAGFVQNVADRSRIKTALHRISGVNKLEAMLITDDQMGGEVH